MRLVTKAAELWMLWGLVCTPSEGDRVVVFGLLGCGHCNHCRRGEPMFCKEARHFSRHQHGTDAAYLVAPARNALLLPDDFSFEMCVLLSCNVGTAYGALRKSETSGDRTLAVFGLGNNYYCLLYTYDADDE